MHLLVLSAFRHEDLWAACREPQASQCTFWCSVLSDPNGWLPFLSTPLRLNAPFGAQCFPTLRIMLAIKFSLSLNAPFGAQCFPTQYPRAARADITTSSQCTFWCSVLSDRLPGIQDSPCAVSMHLLVLSAFRPEFYYSTTLKVLCLNAPFGAQCFPTERRGLGARSRTVSMHLLVLSAFRHTTGAATTPTFQLSQCTFWCSVLSDCEAGANADVCPVRSQCTFWCSVLSDTSFADGLKSSVAQSQCTFWCSVLSDAKALP